MSNGYWVISPLPFPTKEQALHLDLPTLELMAERFYGGIDEALYDGNEQVSPDGTPAWARITRDRLLDGLNELLEGESIQWDRIILGDRHYALISYGEHDETYQADTLSALNDMPLHKEFWEQTQAAWEAWKESQ